MLYIGVHKGTPDDGYICSSKYMMAEYKKRPADFSRTIIEIGEHEHCQKTETNLLKEVSAKENPNYYNKHIPGESFYTHGPRSQETKDKISKKAMGNKRSLGKKMSEEGKQKLRLLNLGKKHSSETKEKMKLVKLGKIQLPETKEKIRLAQLGNSNALGWKQSEEHKIKKWVNRRKICQP